MIIHSAVQPVAAGEPCFEVDADTFILNVIVALALQRFTGFIADTAEHRVTRDADPLLTDIPDGAAGPVAAGLPVHDHDLMDALTGGLVAIVKGAGVPVIAGVIRGAGPRLERPTADTSTTDIPDGAEVLIVTLVGVVEVQAFP